VTAHPHAAVAAAAAADCCCSAARELSLLRYVCNFCKPGSFPPVSFLFFSLSL
jgi:hypothetical protein